MTFFREVNQYLPFLKQRCFKLIFVSVVFASVLAAESQAARAATIVVPSGGNLQAALNAAQPGDTIVLQAGAIYTGPFTLPHKTGNAFVTIQSAELGSLPGSGQRVSPADAVFMPKLVSPGANQAVISTEESSHHYQFIGIEIAPANASVVVSDLIKLGGNQTSLAVVPHDLIFDRCYIHGFPTQEVKRGIALNSGEAWITNSYISDIHGIGYDTQAICGWNGPGPYHIINNYLEASGENLMFGGADPAIENLVPSDIEIRRNHFFKPLSWRVGDPSYGGIPWTVKNLLELKNARRVTIDGNIFENCWVDAQTGWAILIKSQNQDGGCPWCVSEDVVFSNNVITNAENGLNVLAYDPYHPPPSTSPGMGQVKRLTISNNLWYGIRGMFFQGTDGAGGVTLEHNTGFTGNGNTMTLYGRATTNFIVRNNILLRTGYGIKGDGAGEGSNALQTYCPSYSFDKNVVVAADSTQYPSASFYPASLDQVGFVDFAAGNYRLSTSSPYRNLGTDGKDPGVDFDALNAALGGSGLPTPTPTPTPSATPTPTPTPTPSATPTPTPTPNPSPTPNLGPSVLRAKRDGQNLSNQLASSGGAAAPGAGSALEMTAAETEALELFIAEIRMALIHFNAERQLFPAAARIEVELTTALQRAQQALVSSSAGDLPGVRTHLRQTINHLELIGVLIGHPNVTNPIDVASYVVRQHYIDFLDREPDQAGNDYWTNQFAACGTDAACFEAKRIHVSAAFFLSMEFQQTGYFIYRLYKSSYRRVPTIVEFMPDNAVIGDGVIVGTAGWEARLTSNKQQFLEGWVQRAGFVSRYSTSSDQQYVDNLIFNIGVTISPAERNALVQNLANGGSRASVLGRLADNAVFSANEFNRAFVLMQYFGYLRRDYDNAGFTFWFNKLNQFGGNYQSADMVKAFLASQEYRRRFAL
jgi:hypothetical protein